jgi:hypothetical protein
LSILDSSPPYPALFPLLYISIVLLVTTLTNNNNDKEEQLLRAPVARWWLLPFLLAIQETEIRRIEV